MRIFSLKFSDGKSCRCIVMEPKEAVREDRESLISGFKKGYVVSAERIIPNPPERLPWKREDGAWVIEGFTLAKLEDGRFRLSWLGGEMVSADKDEISQAVRDHWIEVLS